MSWATVAWLVWTEVFLPSRAVAAERSPSARPLSRSTALWRRSNCSDGTGEPLKPARVLLILAYCAAWPSNTPACERSDATAEAEAPSAWEYTPSIDSDSADREDCEAESAPTTEAVAVWTAPASPVPPEASPLAPDWAAAPAPEAFDTSAEVESSSVSEASTRAA